MAKDIMSRADKSSVSSGFANRPGSWDNTVGPAIDAVGGALGDVAMGGIGLIVDHIAQPLADMLLGMFDSGQKPSPDTIKQAVADLFSKDTELQKKMGAYQPGDMANTSEGTVLGGRTYPVAKR
jgi:hypothetical protein